MKTPVVSIIVTSFNDAKYLPKCLDALKDQTLEEIEVIGVNDASEDNTLEVLKDYAEKDERFKYIDNPKNIGLAASRNRGIEASTAPFVMFCDADDYYEPETCEELYKAITENQTDLAIGEIRVIYKAHREMKLSDDGYYALKFAGRQQVNDHLIFNTDLSATNKIFRREILEKCQISFPEGLRFEDAYFCVAYFCESTTVFYVNKPLYNYVRHAGSIMSQTWSKEIENDHAIDHLHIAFALYDFLERRALLGRYNELFWCFFGAFESFAIEHSKSHERVKQVKHEAREFVEQHAESFNAAEVAEQEYVRRLSAGRFHISSTRVKQFLLRFMPTYRLSIANIHQLRALSRRNQQLLKQVDELENRQQEVKE